MATQTDTVEKIKINHKLAAPNLWNVIYLNDDKTTMEFVTETLIVIFGHSDETAQELMNNIHNAGSAVVATLPYEIAEEKGVAVMQMARNCGYPLQVKIEENK